MTAQLNSNMWRLNPESIVYLSVKVHGTSIVLGNILVKKPTLMNKIRDFFNRIKDRKIKNIERQIGRINKRSEETGLSDSDTMEISKLQKKSTKLENRKFKNFDTEYYNVYSSRTVIKNQYINKQVNSGFYSVDVWGEYNELLKGKIPQNITIYGEIVGYLTDSSKMIQKGYDYGCKVGCNKLMIYRVNEKLEDGTHREYEIDEVIDFINNLVVNFPEISDRIMPYTLLYHGKFADLYPNIDVANHWNENVLEAMKNDKQMLGMELDEVLCDNKVPREGVCIRIANDPVKECFKLKCAKFLMKESASIDKGEVDIEMMDNYVGDNAAGDEM